MAILKRCNNNRYYNNNITDSESFKFKSKLIDNTNNAVVIDVKVTVP